MNIKNLIIATLIIICTILIYISFFHINTYEDCVLDKMKGQNKNLTSIAVKACKRDFPRQLIAKNNYDKSNLQSYLEHVIGTMAVFGFIGTLISYILTRYFVRRISNKLELRFLMYSIIGCLIGPVTLFVSKDELGPKYLGDVFIYFMIGMVIVCLMFAPIYGFKRLIDHKKNSNM